MANRCLIFTEHDCIWECHSSGACLCGSAPDHWSYRHWSAISSPEKVSYNNYPPSSDAVAPQVSARAPRDQLQISWQKAVESFSHRGLSRQTDRLPAIAAIASCIGVRRADQYLAGLWKMKLIEQLAWRPSHQPRVFQDTTDYIAPSWSWAACPFGITFDPLPRRPQPAGPESAKWSDYEPELIDAFIDTDRHSPYGRVAGGWITVRGIHTEVMLDWPAGKDQENSITLKHGHTCIDLWRGYAGISWLFDRQPVRGITVSSFSGTEGERYLQRALDPDQDEARMNARSGTVRLLWLSYCVALILSRSTRHPNSYERLGLYTSSKGDETLAAWQHFTDAVRSLHNPETHATLKLV